MKQFLPFVALLAVWLCACSTPSGGRSSAMLSAVPFPAPSAIELTAAHVIHLMRMAGFSDAEIVAVGPDLRNALARSGGVRILQRESTRAAYAAGDGIVYVSTANGASFIYRPGDEEAGTGLEVAGSVKNM